LVDRFRFFVAASLGPGDGGGAALAATAIVFLLLWPVAVGSAQEAQPGAGDVELTHLRTASSETFASASGEMRTVLYGQPVHYRDRATGEWRKIKNRLVASGRAGYAVENEANGFKVLFRESLGPDALRVELEGGVAFTLGPAVAAGAGGSARGSEFRYRGLHPSVAVEYHVLGSGVKEELVLADASAPSEYRFVLRPRGATELLARRRGDGGWGFRAPGAPAPLFALAPPTVADSAGASSSPDREGADAVVAAPGKASMDVQPSGDGSFLIEVGIDEAWFRDPARVFPVVLDPTITLQPAPLDGYWEQSCGACTAEMGQDKLLVGNDGGGPSAEDLSRVYVGSAIAYLGSTTPSGWLEADGAAVSRTSEDDLFAAIGTSFGAGDGSATFNLPDLRGRVPVGLNSANTAMDALGESEGTGASSRTPLHSHSFSFTLNRAWSVDTSPGSQFAGAQQVTTSAATSAFLTLRYLIKADPAAPLPVGAVLPYAGASVPTGWLAADGTEASRTVYADLFAAASTIYGAGDGTSTFTLPDARGRVLVGKGSHSSVDALGESEGVAAGVSSPRHSHSGSVSGTRQCCADTSAGSEHVGAMSVSSSADGAAYLTQRMIVKATSAAALPSGALVAFAGAATPPGYLAADGSNVSRTSYADLFAATGTTYGAGDGSTTFALPDPRGRVTAGLGTSADVDTLGESDGQALAARSLSHTHSVTFSANRESGLGSEPGGSFSGTQSFTTSSAVLPFLTLRSLIRSRPTTAYTSGGSAREFVAAVQFDVGAIPTGAAIEEAKLQLYWLDCLEGSCPTTATGSAFAINAHRLTVPWGSTTTSAALASDPATLAAVSFDVHASADTPPGWRSWQGSPVTTLVREWVTGATANYGFLLAGESGSARGIVLASSRATDPNLTPKLEITWSGSAVQLQQPLALHADGAELVWARSEGSSFQRYEVHRSKTAAFTPTPETLVATVGDPAITRYRDTTAAPSTTFHYRVVTDGSASNAVTVTLPADGQSQITLQPNPTLGRATYVAGGNSCLNQGAAELLYVEGGSTPTRSLLGFDLRGIPSGAQVSAAELSLFTTSTVGYALDLHRVTADWSEGSGTSCDSSGATWEERHPSQAWATAGVDFEAAAADSTVSSGGANRWDSFDLVDLVQDWLEGSSANLGLLLKLANESSVGAGNSQVWYADDLTVAPTLRPKLVVTYTDDTHALAPKVALGAPAPAAQVKGTVIVRAGASDDGRVASVQFRLDGSNLGSVDTEPPYELSWDTSGVSRGAHSLSAVATDDAGNQTTASAVSVSVANSAAPSTAITSASATGTSWEVAASASDDYGVEKVEFLVDGEHLSSDASSPYQASFDSLTRPLYDGAHTLTTRAYDSDGNVTGSNEHAISVANTAGSKYQATISASGLPLELAYDPAAASQEETPLSLALTNTSSQTWSAASIVLRARWLNLDGSVLSTSSDTSLGTDLGAGASRNLTLTLTPPTLPEGVYRGRYTLRLDLYDSATSSYFAAKGNKPFEQSVTVNRSASDELGLERYQAYQGSALGSGFNASLNLFNGNLNLSRTLFSQPGIGLNSVATLSYNSLEQGSVSPAGNNWSFALSGLTPFGLPLDIHPNAADLAAGRGAAWIGFTDADGSRHRFDAVTAAAADDLPAITDFVATTDSGCGGCSFSASGNEWEAVIAGAADNSDSAYGLKDFGGASGWSGRTFTRTQVRLASGQTIDANLAVLQLRDASNALIYELYLASDRTLRLWSPAGALRSSSISLSTGVVVPNDGSSIRAEVSALRNDSLIVSVDGVDKITLTGLSGASSGNPRYLRAGIESYDGSSSSSVRVYHAHVGITTLDWLTTRTAALPSASDRLQRRVSKITDAAGLGANPAENREITISYYSANDTTMPAVIGRIRTLADHLGHSYRFSYYNDGNLLRISEDGGANADGSYLPPRAVTFSYTTPSGDGPAIATLNGRQEPDLSTVQSTQLYGLIDARGNETSFAYATSGASKRRLTSLTPRAGAASATSISYDTSTRKTTVTLPLNRSWEHSFDSAGRTTAVTNPLNTTTTIEWTDDNAVHKITEPTGRYLEYAYNQNGYLTDSWDQLRNRTSIGYENLPVDGNDTSGKWEPGRTIAHLSRPIKITQPRGNAGSDTSTVPVGSVVAYLGTATPTGWLEADGASVSRTAHSALLAAIGTSYGPSDSSSFTIPDLRGRTIVGLNPSNASVEALGASDGAAVSSRSPEHTHSLSFTPNRAWSVNTEAGSQYAGAQTINTGAGTAAYLTLRYLIKSDPTALLPVGTVLPYSGSSTPGGWLNANGGTASRSSESELFTVAGTTYGAGDGTTTFGLPDLQGRTTIGKGTHASVDALGDNEGLASGARTPRHNHNATVSGSRDCCADTSPGSEHVGGMSNSSSTSGAAYLTLHVLVKANSTATLPTGALVAFAGEDTPAGYLEAEGDAVSRTSYTDLYAATGTSYGSGDGTSSFNLPDTRGRALIGLGTHSDADALGENDGLTLANRTPAHTHTVTFTAGRESNLSSQPGSDFSGTQTFTSGSQNGGFLTLRQLVRAGNANAHTTTFTYADTSTDRVTAVTDALGHAVTATYNANGTLATQTLPANGDGLTRTTTVNSYDANGLPTQITDAGGGILQAGYRADGALLWTQDANHASYSGGDPTHYRTSYFYDSYGRLGRTSSPKSSKYQPGLLIWTATSYDANDNPTGALSPHYGAGDSGSAPQTTTVYDAMDRPTLVTGPRAAAEGGLVQTLTEYDAAGRSSRVTEPNGVKTTPSGAQWLLDHATETTYDALDRPLTLSSFAVDANGDVDTSQTRTVSYCYDLAGDLRSLTGPKGAATFTGCPALAAPDAYTYTSAGHTTTFVYDHAHRQIRQTAADATETATSYDENGAVTATVDQNGKKRRFFYDDRGAKTKEITPFQGNRVLTQLWQYDPVGNVSRYISPRAYDASPTKTSFSDYVTSYSYDARNRLTRTSLPADSTTPQAYTHNGYDGNGNQTLVSLPTSQGSAANLTADEKTTTEYFDTGAVYTQTVGTTPVLRFDYSAEGWQASRIPELTTHPGMLDLARAMYWDYHPDGLLHHLRDQGGERASYTYDANGNQTTATEGTGITQPGQTPLTIQNSYDGFDQLSKTRTPKPGVSGTWTASLYSYDRHGMPTQLVDNREEDNTGAQTAAGRTTTYAYNAIDQPVTQKDDLKTPSNDADNQQVTYTYTPVGLPATQTLSAADGSGGWTQRQKSSRSYHDNGILEQLTNYNPSNTIIEQHTLAYTTAGIYLNGNRTSDTFKRSVPAGEPAACTSSTCTATWSYDARERLTQETDGTGQTTTFTLDTIGNVTTEAGATTVTRTYTGQRLATVSSAGTTSRYLYDSLGNLDCTTANSWAAAICPDAGHATLLTDYIYDYKSRLESYRGYNGSGTLTQSSDYVNDVLDRPIKQTETESGATTTTQFNYLALSTAVSHEAASGASTLSRSYSYNAAGIRLTMAETPSGSGTSHYAYLYDPHGSVSLLLNQAGALKAAYGYAAYGAANAALTRTAVGFNATTNPYRYGGKRFDTGSGTLDMGARRYTANNGRFLQPDSYSGAISNLGLSHGHLTRNRYSFAGGNPIGYIETDGHWFVGVHMIEECWLYTGCEPSGQTQTTPSTSPATPAPGAASREGHAGTSGGGLEGFASAATEASALRDGSADDCNVQRLDCRLGTFETASWEWRIQWMKSFQSHWRLDEWFNAIIGILEYFNEGTFHGSEKMMVADGGVLWVIQEGFAHVEKGRRIVGDAEPHARVKWAAFFRGRATGRSSEGDLVRLWGNAETAGVQFGAWRARNVAFESGQEEYVWGGFLGIGGVYRWLAQNDHLGRAGPRANPALVRTAAMAADATFRSHYDRLCPVLNRLLSLC
jgi:RHS repeat-associated protein